MDVDDLLPYFPYFFSIGALLFSIFFIWVNHRTKCLIEDAQMWPIVVGKVVRSDIETITETRTESRGGGVRGSRDRTVTYYKPQVRYKYTVNGETFTGDRRAIVESLRYFDITEAQKISKQFPLKSQVNVYYNPANPSEAFLDRSKKNNNPNVALFLAFCSGLVGFFILAWLLL